MEEATIVQKLTDLANGYHCKAEADPMDYDSCYNRGIEYGLYIVMNEMDKFMSDMEKASAGFSESSDNTKSLAESLELCGRSYGIRMGLDVLKRSMPQPQQA